MKKLFALVLVLAFAGVVSNPVFADAPKPGKHGKHVHKAKHKGAKPGVSTIKG
jgi:hypothetical protein